MKRRSSVNRCLLCWSNCFLGSEEGPKVYRNSVVIIPEPQPRLAMAGAVNCVQLQKQLEQVFILRKILDFPASWVEETLRQMSEDAEEKDQNESKSNPETWFSVCNQCMDTSVTAAWKIYQQILSLELRMRKIKDQVKKRMKEGMRKPQNRKMSWRQQSNDTDVEKRIMAFIFPELKVAAKSDEEMEADRNETAAVVFSCSDDDDEFVESILTPAGDSIQDGNDVASTECSFGLVKKKRRGRGRPRTKELRIKSRKKKTFQFAEEPMKPKKYSWYYCRDPLCGARYSDRGDYEAHLRAHEERKQLDVNGDGGDHREKGELDCPHCSFPARDQLELEIHIEKRHEKANHVYDYRCPICDYTVKNDYSKLKDHVDLEHPPDPLNDGSPGDERVLNSSELPVVCPICSRHCESLRSFVFHQRCRHPELAGIQEELAECNECGLKLSSQIKLKSHIFAKHKRHARFVCDECGEGFHFMSRLEAHKITHSGKWKRDFVCHLCGLDYAHKWILEQHYRRFHPSAAPGGEDASGTTGEEFKCKYCDLTSPFKPVIMRHLKQHKEEIGHRCDQCGNFYMSEQGLRRHLRINHPLVKEDIPCPYCHKAFASVEYMKEHVSKYCRLKNIGNQPDTSFSTAPDDDVEVKSDTLTDSVTGKSVTNVTYETVISGGHFDSQYS